MCCFPSVFSLAFSCRPASSACLHLRVAPAPLIDLPLQPPQLFVPSNAAWERLGKDAPALFWAPEYSIKGISKNATLKTALATVSVGLLGVGLGVVGWRNAFSSWLQRPVCVLLRF